MPGCGTCLLVLSASFSTHYRRPSYVLEKSSRISVPNLMYKVLINNFNCLLIMVQSQNLLVSFAVINKSLQRLCFYRREAFKGFSRPKRSAATMWCTATNVKGKQRRRVSVVRNGNRKSIQEFTCLFTNGLWCPMIVLVLFRDVR